MASPKSLSCHHSPSDVPTIPGSVLAIPEVSPTESRGASPNPRVPPKSQRCSERPGRLWDNPLASQMSPLVSSLLLIYSHKTQGQPKTLRMHLQMKLSQNPGSSPSFLRCPPNLLKYPHSQAEIPRAPLEFLIATEYSHRPHEGPLNSRIPHRS